VVWFFVLFFIKPIPYFPDNGFPKWYSVSTCETKRKCSFYRWSLLQRGQNAGAQFQYLAQPGGFPNRQGSHPDLEKKLSLTVHFPELLQSQLFPANWPGFPYWAQKKRRKKKNKKRGKRRDKKVTKRKRRETGKEDPLVNWVKGGEKNKQRQKKSKKRSRKKKLGWQIFLAINKKKKFQLRTPVTNTFGPRDRW